MITAYLQHFNHICLCLMSKIYSNQPTFKYTHSTVRVLTWYRKAKIFKCYFTKRNAFRCRLAAKTSNISVYMHSLHADCVLIQYSKHIVNQHRPHSVRSPTIMQLLLVWLAYVTCLGLWLHDQSCFSIDPSLIKLDDSHYRNAND